MHITHLKLLRRFLVGLIAFVVLAVAVNWLQTWRRRAGSVQRTAEILSSEMLRSADSIEYSENENGVARFKLHAEKLLETRKGKNLLQGTEAYDFNPDGTIRNHIRSRKAEYDSVDKKAEFRDDVRIQMGDGVELHTEVLRYDLRNNIGETTEGLEFQSEQAKGKARAARYDSTRKILDLKGNLDFLLLRPVARPDGTHGTEEVHAISDEGHYSGSDQSMVFRGQARLDSESAALGGDEVEARFTADKRRLSSLACRGHASYQSKDPSEARTMRGDRIDFAILDPPGALERIDISGNASFSSGADTGTQDLQGSEIHVQLDPAQGFPVKIESRSNVRFALKRSTDSTAASGDRLEAGFAKGTNVLDQVHVWGNASLDMGSAGDQLKAEDIRIRFAAIDGKSVAQSLDADQSVQWTSPPQPAAAGKAAQAGRKLSAAKLLMRYTKSGDSLESGDASGNVSLEELQSPQAETAQFKRLLADTVHFVFFPHDNRLAEFTGNGHVRVFYRRPPNPRTESPAEDVQTASESMKATFRETDGTVDLVSQWGGFTYRDGSRTATSGRSDYDAARDLLVLRESPRISDANGSTTGELVEYDQKNKIMTVRRRVRSILGARQGPATPFSGSSGGSPSVVTADSMQYWTEEGRASYTGTVQMLSEDGQLQAQRLDIADSGERVEAEGDVRHISLRHENPQDPSSKPADPKAKKKSSPVLIRSSRLKYDKQENTVHYSDHVELQSEDIWMSSDTMDAKFDAGGRRIERATANGKLYVRQGGREVKGDQGDYLLDPGKFVVTGNLAQIHDPDRGTSHARRLTFFTSDDRILLENR